MSAYARNHLMSNHTDLGQMKAMAVLLAASGCDLGDGRDVLRTLKAEGHDLGDIVAYSDDATELARSIRANTTQDRGSVMTGCRLQAARQAFWTDRPLNLAFRQEIGERPFSLKQFIKFVETMSPDEFAQHIIERL